MATGPAAGLDARYSRIGRAAFALARRICGDDEAAAEIVEQAFADSPAGTAAGVGDGLLLRRVRDLACRRRTHVPYAPAAPSSPPPSLGALSCAHWRVLDLVALRGAGVTETAVRLGMSEDAVLAHLREGVSQTRELLGLRQADDHAHPPRLALVR